MEGAKATRNVIRIPNSEKGLCMNNQTQQLNVLIVDGEAESKVLNKWVVMRRYIGAFFIYIIYWITLSQAIKNAIGPVLSPKEANELV